LIEAVADRIEGAPVAGRRRWSDAFKADMAARSCEAGANVSVLAREIGISPSQLFGWRSVLIRKGEIERRGAAGGGVSSEPQTALSPVIEIDVNGVKVLDGADVDEAHLSIGVGLGPPIGVQRAMPKHTKSRCSQKRNILDLISDLKVHWTSMAGTTAD